MKIDKQKEKEFYDKSFSFSYSSMNRLLFSPRLFYKDYILKDKEIKMDKHLVEGRVIHTLLLQPDEFNNQFVVLPAKLPSDTLRRVLKNIILYTDVIELSLIDDNIILDSLHEIGLYQSLKDSDKRIAKVRTLECEEYYKFLSTTNKDIIDQDTLDRCKNRVNLVKNNKEFMNLFSHNITDFELDDTEIYNEKYLKCELKDYKFGLKGFVDRYIIDHNKKEITIIDLKTTGKTISDFPETVNFYNYWLQAAIYVNLVLKNLSSEKASLYKINFMFAVIDKYDQMFVFPVSDKSLNLWGENLHMTLEMVNFHYKENKYELPYQFMNEKVYL